MKTFRTCNTIKENVEVANNLLIDLGIEESKLTQSGYSESNGVSVYFKHSDLIEDAVLRVSDHGISNRFRLENTICFRFDSKESEFYKFKSSQKGNLQIAKIYNLVK